MDSILIDNLRTPSIASSTGLTPVSSDEDLHRFEGGGSSSGRSSPVDIDALFDKIQEMFNGFCITDNDFANLHCGATIQNSPYEGNIMKNTGPFIEKILNGLFNHEHTFLQDSAFKEEARRLLQTYLEDINRFTEIDVELRPDPDNPFSGNKTREVQALSKKFHEELIQLEVGKRLTLRGGWVGHAMVIQFEKCPKENESDQDQYDLIVINTGAGSELFHTKGIVNAKKKFSPIMRFTKIPLRLLSEDYIFAILSKKAFVSHMQPLDIYVSQFGMLSDYRDINPITLHDLASGQRAGTCLIKSLLTLMHYTLKKEGKETYFYKKIVFFMKYASLLAYFKEHKKALEEDTKEASDRRQMMKEAIKNLMMMGSKGLRKALLSDDEVHNARSVIQEIRHEIKKAENLLAEKAKEKVNSYSLEPSDDHPQISLPYQRYRKEASQGFLSIPIVQFDQISEENIQTLLDQCYHCANALQRTDGAEICKKQIENLVKKLSLKDLWLSKVSDFGAMKQLVTSLVKLQDLYVFSLQKGPGFYLPDEQNTSLILFGLIHFFASKMEKRALEKDPDAPQFSSLFWIDANDANYFSSPENLFFAPEEYVRRQEIIEYFTSVFKRERGVLHDHYDSLCIAGNGFKDHQTPIQSAFLRFVDKKDVLVRDYFSSRLHRKYVWDESATNRMWHCAELIGALGESKDPSFFSQMDWEYVSLLNRSSLLTKACFLPNMKFREKSDENRCALKMIKKENFWTSLRPSEAEFYLLESREVSSKNVNEYFSSRLWHRESDMRDVSHPLPSKRATVGLQMMQNYGFWGGGDGLQENKAHFKVNEPHLSVMNLLAFFEENRELLLQGNYQTFFIEQFFISIFEERQMMPPLDFNKWNSSNFKTTLLTFLQQGKKIFQHKDDVDSLKALLFFFRVTRLLLSYYKEDDPFFNLLVKEMQELDLLIEKEKWPPSLKAAIHVEKLLFFDAMQKIDRPIGTLEEILESYFFFTRAPKNNAILEDSDLRIMRKFIAEKFGTHFAKEEVEEHLVDILDKANIPIQKKGNWKQDQDCPYIFHLVDEERARPFYSVNLLSAALYKEGEGIVSFDNVNEQENSHLLRTLFKDKKLTFYTIGEMVYFTEGEKTFRYHRNDKELKHLQWNISQDNWAEYSVKAQFLPYAKTLPYALFCDHYHFSMKRGLNDVDPSIVYIVDTNFHIKYLIDEEGIIHGATRDPTNDQIVVADTTIQIPKKEDHDISSITNRFERAEFTLIEKHANGDQVLTFPRYEYNGKPLTFTKKADTPHFVYAFDPRFYLKKEVEEGQLDRFTSFLLLASLPEEGKEEEHLALIPQVVYKKGGGGFRRGSGLNTDDEEKLESLYYSIENEWKEKHALIRSYSLIPVKGGQLASQSDKDHIFASYLYLGQSDYRKANDYLKKISPESIQSRSEEMWLMEIFSPSDQKSMDRSIYASSIRLQAALILAKKNIRAGKRPDVSIKDLMGQYISEISRVPGHLKFSYEDELFLLHLAEKQWLIDLARALSHVLYQINSDEQKYVEPLNELIEEFWDKEIEPSDFTRLEHFAQTIPFNNQQKQIDSILFALRQETSLRFRIRLLENKGELQDSHFYEQDPNQTIFIKLKQPDLGIDYEYSFGMPILGHTSRLADDVTLADFYVTLGELPADKFWKLYTMIVDLPERDDREVVEKKLFFLLQEAYLFLTKCGMGQLKHIRFFLPLLLHVKNKPPFPRCQFTLRQDQRDWLKNLLAHYEIQEIAYEVNPIQAVDIDLEKREKMDTYPIDPLQFPFAKEAIQETLSFTLPSLEEVRWHHTLLEVKESLRHFPEERKKQVCNDALEEKLLRDFDEMERCLAKEDETIKAPLQEAFNEFRKGYNRALTRRKERKLLQFTPLALAELKQTLQEALNAGNDDLEQKRKDLVDLASSYQYDDPKDQLNYNLEIASESRKKIEMRDLVYLFIHRKEAYYEAKIPPLKGKKQEIQHLINETAKVLYLGVERHHLQRLSHKIEEIEKGNELALFELNELLAEGDLLEWYKKRPALLAFEYNKGIVFRKNPDQVAGITHLEEEKEGKYKDNILQMGMGGGKTSVVIANLLAEREGIPILVTPAFQFYTIFESIKKTLKDCFNMETVALHYKREELTIPVLNHIIEILHSILHGKSHGVKKALVLCPEMLQTLELEYTASLKQLKENRSLDPKLFQKIKLLSHILTLFRDYGNGVGDEIQTLFDINKEVNFSLGDDVSVKQEYISLMREIFKVIATHKMRIQERDLHLLGDIHRANISRVPQSDLVEIPIEDVMHLSQNRQKYLSQEVFKTHIAPEIARILAETYKPLRLDGSEVENERAKFAKYVTNQMNGDIQRVIAKQDPINPLSAEDLDDMQFVEYLYGLKTSPDKTVKLSAELIALTKHLLMDILSSTFTQMGNVKYGRSVDPKIPGKVKPFICAGTESTTEFAYHYEAAAFHFATALHYGVTKEQIVDLAETFDHDAALFLETSPSYEETAPAVFFKELFGCFPNEINAHLDEIVASLNSDKERMLNIEALTVNRYVKYYSLRLSSNAHSLFSMLRSFTATGGTIDPHVLPIPMQLKSEEEREQSLDLMVNPEVIHELLIKINDHSIMMIQTENKELQQEKNAKELFEEMIFSHPEKNRISSVLDAGGMFKNFEPKEIATSLLETMHQVKCPKKGVLFYSRAHGSIAADYFTLIKNGELYILKDTSEEELMKYQLKPEDCISFYDQRHCLGTDIKQPPKGIGLLTLDKGPSASATTDSLCQAIMRLRQFFLGQEITMVVPEYIAKKIGVGRETPSLYDILSEAHPKMNEAMLTIIYESIRSEAIIRAQDIYRSYQRALFNALYQVAMTKLLSVTQRPDLSLETGKIVIGKWLEALFPAIFLVTEDNPLELFGNLSERKDPLEALENYKTKMLVQLKNSLIANEIDPDEVMTLCERASNEILEEAKEKISHFMKEVSVMVETEKPKGTEGAGAVVEVEVAAQVAKEEEVEMDLDLELKQELEAYQYNQKVKIQEISEWSTNEMRGLIENILEKGIEGISHAALQPDHSINLVSSYLSEEKGYLQPYNAAFDNNFFATKHAFIPYDPSLKIFHEKMPPIDHILYVKCREGKSVGILLSQPEAAMFKLFLEREGDRFPEVSLLVIDKKEVSKDHIRLDEKDDDLDRLLLQANILNCHTSYLLRHSEEFLSWMEEGYVGLEMAKMRGKTLTEIKSNYLRLKAEIDSSQKKPLYMTLLQFDKLRELKKKQHELEVLRKEFGNLTEEEVKGLNNNQVEYIAPHLVKYLDPRQVRYLPDAKLRYLTEKEQIQAVDPTLVRHLDSSQIKDLTKEQVKGISMEPKSVKAISPDVFSQFTIDDYDGSLQYLIDNASKGQIANIRDGELIKKVPLYKIKDIDPRMVPYLGEENIKEVVRELKELPGHLESLSQKQVETLGVQDQDLLRALPPSLFVYFSKEQMQKMSKEQVEKIEPNPLVANRIDEINPEYLPFVSREVFRAITRKELLQSFQDKAIIQQLLDIQVKDLLDAQLKHLDKIQVYNLDPLRWVFLEQRQFDFFGQPTEMSIDFVKHLLPNVVKFCPRNMIRYLQKEQIIHYPLELIDEAHQIDQKLIEYLPDEVVKELLDPRVISLLSSRQISLLPRKEQIRLVPPEKLQALTDRQMQLFDLEVDQDFIDSLPSTVFEKCSPLQLRRLNADQVSRFPLALIHRVGELHPERVDHLPIPVIEEIRDPEVLSRFRGQQAINAIHHEGIIHLGKEQIKHLQREKWCHLLDRQVQLFHEEEDQQYIENFLPQIFEKCSPLQLGRLNADQVSRFPLALIHRASDLHPERVDHLPIAVIEEIRDPAVLRHLTREESIRHVHPTCIDGLRDEQLRHLSREQLSTLSLPFVDRVRFLNPKELDALSSELIHAIKEPPVIHLFETKEAVKKLKREQVPHLLKHQLHLLDSSQITHLAPHQIPHLPAAFVTRISTSQVPHLRTKEQFKEASFRQILYANPNQMQFFTPMEKLAYVVTTIALSLLSLIVCLPIAIIHLLGRICHLNLLASAYEFNYRNLRRMAKLFYYTITCCREKPPQLQAAVGYP